MNTLVQDLRYAMRLLAKNPGFTTVIILTLALGIGANTAIFSVINAIILRPLPYDRPGELAMVWETSDKSGSDEFLVAYPNFEDWKTQNSVFQELGVLRTSSFTLTGVDVPERVRGVAVSSGFFSTLRVNAAIGRTFSAEEDRAGAPNVVVLSDRFWQRHFAADPNVVGRTLTLDGDEFAVIGVLPADFDFPVRIAGVELWTPTGIADKWLTNRGGHTFRVIGRLKSGVTFAQAQAEMDTIARRLQQQYPDSNTGYGVNVVPLHKQVVGEVRPALLILLGAVALVLLIACANVASLLLARSEDRKQELAVRTALGAGRAQLIRQLLTESLLLGMLGAAVGVALALWCKDALLAIIPRGVPRMERIAIDGWVLAFTLAVAVGTGLVFGLAPALNATRRCLPASLKESRSTTASTAQHRLQRLLVVSEVAVALVLLVGAGLLMRSFLRLTEVNLGFQPDHIMSFQMVLPDAYSGGSQREPAVPIPYASGKQRSELYQQVLERIAALPGVISAGASTSLPLSDSGIGLNFSVLGWEEAAASQDLGALFDSVSPGYFKTMGIPLLRGRMFTDQDRRDGGGVMLISQSMAEAARRLRPDLDPIGLRLKISAKLDKDEPESFEVVGIVGDVRESLTAEPELHMYVPFQQQAWGSMYFAVRTAGDPSSMAGALRSAVSAVTKDVAAYGFNSIEGYWRESVAHRLFAMLLLTIFAGLAVSLAVIGLYGMLSYSVAQQVHEIGLRMALGAMRGDVLSAVLRRGLSLTGIGIGIGMAVSLAASRVLTSLLYDISTFDPLTLIGVPVLLLAISVPACYVPARRATKVDPMVALRCE